MIHSGFILIAVVASVWANVIPRTTAPTTELPARPLVQVFITKEESDAHKRQNSEVDVLISQEESGALDKRREQHSSHQAEAAAQFLHKRQRRGSKSTPYWNNICGNCDKDEWDLLRKSFGNQEQLNRALTNRGQRPITEIRLPGDPPKPERGSADGHVTYHKNVGLVGHASAQGELYKSRDGNTLVTGEAAVTKVLAGPARHARPDASVGVQVEHKFHLP